MLICVKVGMDDGVYTDVWLRICLAEVDAIGSARGDALRFN